MKTKEQIQEILNNVKYKNWEISLIQKESCFFVQAIFSALDPETSKFETQRSRKWYISPYSTDTEIIRTCWLCIRQTEEHELCERFTYKGIRVFNPHYSVEGLAYYNSMLEGDQRKQNLEILKT